VSPHKAAPAHGRVIHRTAGGTRDAPAHDPLPFKQKSKTSPKDKAWCMKCNAWRFFRNIRRVVLKNNQKAYQGICVTCRSPHIFHAA
jgi:hypothetical protein